MNKETLLSLLTDAAEDATAAANAVQDGLMARVRDGMEGHPRSPSFDAGQSTNAPPEDLPDELRGRLEHADPTGSAAVQTAMRGDRARDDAKALVREAMAARRALRRFVETAARYNPRPANVVDRAESAKNDDPGCESCARVASPGTVGRAKGQQTPLWNPVALSTVVGDRKVALCDWCWRGEVGAKHTGELPAREDVESYRDTKRSRKRSA